MWYPNVRALADGLAERRIEINGSQDSLDRLAESVDAFKTEVVEALHKTIGELYLTQGT